MALDVLAGPGCDATKLPYVESVCEPGDVVISAGSLYAALGGVGVPSSNTATLRLALYLRSTAIKQAREKQLSGFILTSNGNRADLARLQAEAGGAVRILKMTEAQACARIAQIVPAGDRRANCDEGIKRRWFGRYRPAAGDIEVGP